VGCRVDPGARDELATPPEAAVEAQAPEAGEVHRAGVEAALRLLEAIVPAIEAPRGRRFRAERLPQVLGQKGAHGAAGGASQDQPDQERVVVVVLPAAARLAGRLGGERQPARLGVVVRARQSFSPCSARSRDGGEMSATQPHPRPLGPIIPTDGESFVYCAPRGGPAGRLARGGAPCPDGS
jgi:hypothetical protein